MTRRSWTLASLLVALTLAATVEGQQTPPRDHQEAVKLIVKKNLFAPWRPKPPARVKPRKPEAPKKKVVTDVREELWFTGTIFDNGANVYYATVETVDGDKKLLLRAGEKIGLYEIKVILFDRLGLTNKKTKKDSEVLIGDTFEGDVTGQTSSRKSTSSGSRSSGRNRDGKAPKAKSLPTLSPSKREDVLKRLRERARKSREKRERMNKKGKK